MNAAAAVRAVVASTLAFATLARGQVPAAEPTGPGQTPSRSTQAGRDLRPADKGAQDAARKPPPAVIVIPLVGLVLLPLTLPVAGARARRAAERAEGAPPRAAEPAPLPPKQPAPPAAAPVGGDAAPTSATAAPPASLAACVGCAAQPALARPGDSP